MKRLAVIVSLIILILVNHSCAEYVDNTVNNIDPILIADSLVTPSSSPEKGEFSGVRKYIYLTIDDAPLNGSEYIDSVIAAAKIKTSLFVVGNGINGSKRFRQYYKRLCENPYVEICNHSYSHANNRYIAFYKNPELVLNDFEKNQADLNISCKIARLPGRNLWLLGERKKNYKQTGGSSAELLAEK